METSPAPPTPRRHLWPWIVLLLVILGAVLAVLGITAEARRTRERRQYYLPAGENAVVMPATTNAAVPPTR